MERQRGRSSARARNSPVALSQASASPVAGDACPLPACAPRDAPDAHPGHAAHAAGLRSPRPGAPRCTEPTLAATRASSFSSAPSLGEHARQPMRALLEHQDQQLLESRPVVVEPCEQQLRRDAPALRRPVHARARAGRRRRTAGRAGSATSRRRPLREAIGNWAHSVWQKASMVMTRSRAGEASSCQPRSRSRCTAALAKGASGLPVSTPCAAACSASSTRSRISAAALRVKVIASTSSGSSTQASNASRRQVSTVVLPDPAGACSKKEPRVSTAAARASLSSRHAPRSASASDSERHRQRPPPRLPPPHRA